MWRPPPERTNNVSDPFQRTIAICFGLTGLFLAAWTAFGIDRRMFHDWDSFYLLVGSAAAALIGLLFVVATLTSNLDQGNANSGNDIYLSPTVFHFAVVLVLSGLALTPGVTPLAAELVVGAGALAGLAYAGRISLQLYSGKVPTPPHWTDFWCYGAAPTAIYLCLGAVAAALGSQAYAAEVCLGAALMALLLVVVRNAWDLVTYLAPLKNKADDKD